MALATGAIALHHPMNTKMLSSVRSMALGRVFRGVKQQCNIAVATLNDMPMEKIETVHLATLGTTFVPG